MNNGDCKSEENENKCVKKENYNERASSKERKKERKKEKREKERKKRERKKERKKERKGQNMEMEVDVLVISSVGTRVGATAERDRNTWLPLRDPGHRYFSLSFSFSLLSLSSSLL